MDLHNSSTGGTTITLTWSPPGDGEGSTDVLYTITYTIGGSSITIHTHSTTITITGLSPRTTYTFHVRAEIGSDSNNNRSSTITVTTAGASEHRTSIISSSSLLFYSFVTVPTAPHSTRLVGSVLIWEAPDNLFGESLLYYEILSSSTNNTAHAVPLGTSREARFELPTGITGADHQSFIWVSRRGHTVTLLSEPAL